MKKEFDKVTRGRAIGFLVWFRNQYGIWTQDTYYKMAEKYGQCNYGTCRNMILELIEAGYIKAWNEGTRQRRFYINRVKYNELVNPYIFHKEEDNEKASI